MISPSEFYEKSLYPLQNGVLHVLSNCKTRFYLTGGTGLSRGYYQHRHSDDLDFFVNNDADYRDQVDEILASLKADGFLWDTNIDYIKAVGFTSLKVRRAETDVLLKLDFVNDSAPHFGDIVKTGFFDRVDSVRNILSNKLTALFRYAAKDAADIREIALHETINWAEIIGEAREKEEGVELPVIAEILRGIPRQEFETIQWVKNPGWEAFKADIDRIVYDMVGGV
jgi:predicted nucleotidyltransferase component of viral defense system